MTVHLKDATQADLPATARVITDEADRRSISDWIVKNAWTDQDVDRMVAHSPIIEVTIADLAA